MVVVEDKLVKRFVMGLLFITLLCVVDFDEVFDDCVALLVTDGSDVERCVVLYALVVEWLSVVLGVVEIVVVSLEVVEGLLVFLEV